MGHIVPRVAESGAHSMYSLIMTDGLMKEPSAQAQHATNDFCIAPCLAESGAHKMDSLMKEPSAQLCEASIMPLPYGPPFYFKAFAHNRRAKTGVLDGANGVKTGEKWAQLTPMCIPNSTG